MTRRVVGSIELTGSEPVQLRLPAGTDLPDKQHYSEYAVWEVTPRMIKPVTAKAVADLDEMVKKIQNLGYHACTKDGRRKTSSIKYGIQTYGVEPFTFIK